MAPPAPKKSPEPVVSDLQKQIDDAIKELEKVDKDLEKAGPGLPNNASEMIRRRLEEIRQHLHEKNAALGLNSPLILPGRGLPRMGVALQRPAQVLIDQLDLPAGRGLVIVEVQADSPAARAGLRKSDILLELAGKAVSSDINEFYRDLRDLKSDVEVGATILRRGQKESIKGLKLAEAKNLPGLPNFQLPDLAGAINPGLGNVRVRTTTNGNEVMKVRIANDDVVIEYGQGELRATIQGSLENGAVKVSEIRIRDGKEETRVGAVAEVPERHRALVARMLDTVK